MGWSLLLIHKKQIRKSALSRISVCGDIVEIKLTKGMKTFVDICDYDLVKNSTWGLAECKGHYYATTRNGNKRVLMHRVLMNPGKGFVVDHIDGNGLNNRRENLRICLHKENIRNSIKEKIKGASFCKRRNKWRSYIKINGKYKHLGYFDSETLAAMAYNKSAKLLFKDFASLNNTTKG